MGPYYLKLFDGYFPMNVKLTINYPTEQLRYARMEPATVEGADLEFSDGAIRFAGAVRGQAATRVPLSTGLMGLVRL